MDDRYQNIEDQVDLGCGFPSLEQLKVTLHNSQLHLISGKLSEKKDPLERFADIAISLQEDERLTYDKKQPSPIMTEIKVTKNKTGLTGSIKLNYTPRFSRFEEI